MEDELETLLEQAISNQQGMEDDAEQNVDAASPDAASFLIGALASWNKGEASDESSTFGASARSLTGDNEYVIDPSATDAEIEEAAKDATAVYERRRTAMRNADQGGSSMSVGPRRDLMEMTPVVADSSAFPKEADSRKLREIGEEEYAKLVGPTWTNRRDGRRFRFTLQQFGKPRSHSADPRIMKLIPSLPSLLEDAVLLETEPELDKIKYKNIDAWHTCAARVRLDGQPLIVQLTTFEQNGMEMVSLYHDHNVLWEEALSWGQKNSENLPKGPTDPVTNRAVMMEALARSKLFQLLAGGNSNSASSMSIGPRAQSDLPGNLRV